jgi:hypothetical protein
MQPRSEPSTALVGRAARVLERLRMLFCQLLHVKLQVLVAFVKVVDDLHRWGQRLAAGELGAGRRRRANMQCSVSAATAALTLVSCAIFLHILSCSSPSSMAASAWRAGQL